jgi:UDP-glucuronate 4-epimerase
MEFIEAIEKAAGKPAEKIFMDMQPGDVPITYADTSRLREKTGYQPNTDIQTGVDAVVAWYRDYYKL